MKGKKSNNKRSKDAGVKKERKEIKERKGKYMKETKWEKRRSVARFYQCWWGIFRRRFRKGKNAGAENSKESRKATRTLVGERYFLRERQRKIKVCASEIRQ